MPTNDLAKQAEVVRADIARLEADLKTLLNTVGGAIGAAISDRVHGPLSMISSHVDPLLSLLGAAAQVPVKRGPGRPKKEEGEEPKRRARRRGGRGRKVNLSPEAIQDALKQNAGNKSAAARTLGVSLPTFYKYLNTAAPEAAPKSSPAPKKKRAAKKG